MIGSGTRVQIACRLQGFKVANGNPWWYRIAGAPWSGPTWWVYKYTLLYLALLFLAMAIDRAVLR